MMRLSNNSSSSVSSKDKELPPIPSPLPSPLANVSVGSSSDPTAIDEAADLLQAKTLKRKNFKKLSLQGGPTPAVPSPSSSPRTDSLPTTTTPVTLSRLTPRSSTSYCTNINNNSNNNTHEPPAEPSHHNGSAAASTAEDAILKFEPSSLRQKRNKMRHTPILNLDLQSTTTNGSNIVNQIVSRSSPTSVPSLNINQSNRDVDPETHSSHDVILSQLSSLDLSKRSNSPSANKKSSLHPTEKGGRKRQTVISSISPTKSSASSPLENQQPTFEESISFTSEPTYSPIATTSSIKLNNNDLLTLKSLGSGNSGTVSKILHKPTQKTMAKKIIHIDSKTVIKTQIIRELKILHECQSPFIIEFYGAFVNNNNTIVICMEYCNCGSLDKILPLCELKQFPLFVLKKLSYAILSGLTYLYTTHKIIHRDVKPSNVLMTHKGEFKLCDFGVSRELTNSLAMADTFVGTSTYMSPERIQGLNYGVRSDIWSMGLMLIELATGLQVWNDDDEQIEAFSGNGGPEGILDLLQRIVNETPPSLTNKVNAKTGEKYDAVLCSFIDSCLVKKDTDRKSPWDLLADKDGFLSGVEQGVYDKDMKQWAKKIRKCHK